MSASAKRNVVAAALAICALWPAVHHGLVRGFEIDPWRFFGWAMYSAPRPDIEVFAARLEGGSWRAVRIPSAAEPAARSFAEARLFYGRLHSPAALANALYEVWPREPSVGIVVRRYLLDRDTAMVVHEDRLYRYTKRDGRLRLQP